MVKRLSIVALLVILYSCSTETKNEEKAAEPKVMVSETDSICTSSGIMFLSDTSQQAFISLYKDIPDTSEANNLKLNAKEVSRHGDTLRITFAKLGTRSYINNSDDELSEEFINYRYVGKLKNINYHILFVSYIESFSYLAVNAETGKETDLCGMPAVSPDRTKLIAGCYDLAAGFVFNGLEFFEVTKDSLRPLWERELSKWGPGHMAWLDNQTLLAEKNSVDSTMNTFTSYIKISNVK